MTRGVWGVSPHIESPPLWTMPGPRYGVPCPSAGPRPPIQGSGGTPDPDPIRDPKRTPQGPPRRGAPGGPPGGGKFPGARGARKSFRKFRTAPETGPRARTPKTALLGSIYSQNRPIWGVRRGYPPDHVSGPRFSGSGKSGSFVGHLITLPVGTDQPPRDSWDSWPWDPTLGGPGGWAGPGGGVIKRVIGYRDPGPGGLAPPLGMISAPASRSLDRDSLNGCQGSRKGGGRPARRPPREGSGSLGQAQRAATRRRMGPGGGAQPPP